MPSDMPDMGMEAVGNDREAIPGFGGGIDLPLGCGMGGDKETVGVHPVAFDSLFSPMTWHGWGGIDPTYPMAMPNSVTASLAAGEIAEQASAAVASIPPASLAPGPAHAQAHFSARILASSPVPVSPTAPANAAAGDAAHAHGMREAVDRT